MNQCSYSDQCDISKFCQQDQSFVNFFALNDCYIQTTFLILLILIVVILLIFRCIQSIVNGFLAPSIESLTERLKLSQPVAAVTLLALANGAGDVLTALAASNNSEAVEYNIGALYGAGFFVCTVVVALNIYNSQKGVQLHPSAVCRDLGFYILATFIILCYGIKGEFNLEDSIIMLLIYIMYIIFVVVQDKVYSSDVEIMENQVQENFEQLTQYSSIITEDKEIKSRNFIILNIILNLMDRILQFTLSLFVPYCAEDYEIVQIAFRLLLSENLAIFILFGLNQELFIAAGISWLLFVCLLALFKIREYDPYHLVTFIKVITVISSLFLTYLFSGVLIDSLTFLGSITNMPSSYLGITIIAVGNALPEALVTIQLSKQGFAVMSMTGAYAGQLFGLLIGMGLSLFKKIQSNGAVQFNLFTNPIMITIVLATLITLLITISYSFRHQFMFNKNLSHILGVMYILTILITTLEAIFV